MRAESETVCPQFICSFHRFIVSISMGSEHKLNAIVANARTFEWKMTQMALIYHHWFIEIGFVKTIVQKIESWKTVRTRFETFKSIYKFECGQVVSNPPILLAHEIRNSNNSRRKSFQPSAIQIVSTYLWRPICVCVFSCWNNGFVFNCWGSNETAGYSQFTDIHNLKWAISILRNAYASLNRELYVYSPIQYADNPYI